MLTACSIGERVRDEGGHSLVVLNDVSVMVRCRWRCRWRRSRVPAGVLLLAALLLLPCERCRPALQLAPQPNPADPFVVQVRMWESITLAMATLGAAAQAGVHLVLSKQSLQGWLAGGTACCAPARSGRLPLRGL